MFEIFQYDYMTYSFIASILASIAFGIVGSFIVVKRIVFISGGIAHTAYGGIGLGYLLGFDPVLGALGFSIAASVLLAVMRNKKIHYEDTLIGILWASSMALGALFIHFSSGYTTNLMSYLFGNILMIPKSELIIMGILDLFIIVLVSVFYQQLRAITFDEEFSRTIGLPVDGFYILLYILIGFTTVILIRLVGIVLVIALLTIPPAIGLLFVKSLKGLMVTAVLFGLLFSIVGLLLSYYLNFATGATIILLSSAVYFILYGIKKKAVG